MKEWKSRVGVEPPLQFFADVIAYLNRAFPGASLDRAMLKQLRPYLVTQWRLGQNAPKAAAATCSCDGTSIVPSPASQVDLPKRAALPPKGATPGSLFGLEDLREAGMLPKARVQAEIAARQVEHYQTEMRRLAASLDSARAQGKESKKTARMLAAAQREVAKYADKAANLNRRVNELVMSAAYSLPERVTRGRSLTVDRPIRRTKGGPGRQSPAVLPPTPIPPESGPDKKTARRPGAKKEASCTTCTGAKKGPETIPSEDQALLENLVREFAQAGVDELQGKGS